MRNLPKTKKSLKRNSVGATYSYRQKKTESLTPANTSLLSKIQSEFNSNQSYLNLILGLIIILIAGVLVFNYLKRNQANLGPATDTTSEQETVKDADPNNLPGKYTVKEGDTLFTIAQTYYSDGYKFSKLAAANQLASADQIEVGQVLDIPKLDGGTVASEANAELGTGGATNQTIWGEAIAGDSYTVVEGDWLSKIAGRAYGDIMAFDKIAKANNITDPNVIEPGMTLKIPR